MLDRERILAKVDELEGYLRELRVIEPASFKEFQKLEKKRACERLLQISVEVLVDICHLFVMGLKLGLPAEEDDILEKMERAHVVSLHTKETLKEMRGFRNILVHEYGIVDDRIVYDIMKTRLTDFETFKQEILKALKKATREGND